MAEFLRLKKSNCKNCYKCIRHCPVKSIRFSANQAHIIADECVLCGQCFVVCPQGAKEIISSIEKVQMFLSDDDPVIASIAPSFIANYNGVGIEQLEKALKKLGFAAAEETAIGATIVKREYEKILESGAKKILISSCCHSVNLLIQKHFPSSLKYLADVVSPMQAHCIDIKKRYPNAKTVFIGPCIAKKDEAERYPGIVDAVLTFEELTNWFENEDIVLEVDENAAKNEKSRARFFPTSGGILKTMDCSNPKYTYTVVDGMENCIATLRDIEAGGITDCFIEMSACKGSCIGGPVMEKYRSSPLRDYKSVERYAGTEDFEVDMLDEIEVRHGHPFMGTGKSMPGKADIESILRQMGKTKPEHELNCGSCGYNTCREKAIAVYQGKADMSMCLPFLKDKAESFSDNIVNNTPNGIIVLNDSLEVQQINRSALKMMNIRTSSDVLGEPVVRIMDPTDVMEVQRTGRGIYNKHVYFAEYNRYAEETILYDRDYRVIMCILRDVTNEEEDRSKKETIARQTIEVTDKVVEKQMRVVQEIASLLGETAAETKIALTKLKESLSDE